MTDALQTSRIPKSVQKAIEVGNNIFFHAPGGCGKSYMLKLIAMDQAARGRKVAVTAMTGTAALELLNNATPVRTFHSWAGIQLGTGSPDQLYALAIQGRSRKRWLKVELLIMDEVGVLGKELFEKITYVAQKVRRNTLPFGGIQLIMSGDFLQLPPINDQWLFRSLEFERCKMDYFTFTKTRRYDDMRYIQLLLRARKEACTSDDIQLLDGRVEAYRKWKTADDLLPPQTVRVKPTVLYPKKVDVAAHNKRELDMLPSEMYNYTARDSYLVHKTVKLESRLDEMCPKELSLKVGAQVMITRNLIVEEGIVNGTRAAVKKLTGHDATVCLLDGSEVLITRIPFNIERKGVVKATRMQLPLVVAFSCSIHKAQGKTLSFAVADLGPDIFAPGQAYVALSRVKSLYGLLLYDFHPTSIRADRVALEFVNCIE